MISNECRPFQSSKNPNFENETFPVIRVSLGFSWGLKIIFNQWLRTQPRSETKTWETQKWPIALLVASIGVVTTCTVVIIRVQVSRLSSVACIPQLLVLHSSYCPDWWNKFAIWEPEIRENLWSFFLFCTFHFPKPYFVGFFDFYVLRHPWVIWVLSRRISQNFCPLVIRSRRNTV